MIDKKLIKNLKKEYSKKELERRQIIRASNDILFQAKKTIFSIHRNEKEKAKKNILEMTNSFKSLEKNFGNYRLQTEGSYQAAAEEYVEAICLFNIVNNKKIEEIKELKLNHFSYLGGICDLLGELNRYAINQVSLGNYKIAINIKKQAEDIMSDLIDFDLTGYLRTKYDQAKGHLRKIEQINYDLRLRDKK